MSDAQLLSEPATFKFTLLAAVGWLGTVIAEADFGQLVGFIIAFMGIILQVGAYIRNNRTERREAAEHDRRAALEEAEEQRKRELHTLQVQLMLHQIAEQEEEARHDKP